VVVGAGAVIQPATATPIKWLTVNLGVHRFGHLTAPDAVVARAGASDVGFECGKPSACPSQEPPPASSCGCIDVLPQGPTSFDVGRDGSIWLLDGLNHRLLVWQRGRPNHRARAVALPRNLDVGDFALAPNGTVYVYSARNVAGRPNHDLFALTTTGRVRWKAPTAITNGQALLRIGSDGALYAVGGFPSDNAFSWTPLTTPAGRPLPLAQQRRRTSATEPMPSGLTLLATEPSAHEVHFALIGRDHRVVRAWRVTSRTNVGIVRAVPAMLGGDLVVGVQVSHQVGSKFRAENLILRLRSSGETRLRVALDPRALWDPDGTTARTALRVGPDGRLYQLRTNPATGASVVRYSLVGR
jgi:hypothetical protein